MLRLIKFEILKNFATTTNVNPKILLMDEPFGNLYSQTRQVMQTELLRTWELHRSTALFVTHRINKAVYLADRVVIMIPWPDRIRRLVTVKLQRTRDPSASEFNEFLRICFKKFKMTYVR